jgi:peptidoglycan/xylan/chitin deacetylase (PgdA/CDA1 family)
MPRAMRWLMALAHRPRAGAPGDASLTIVRHHRVYADEERPLYRLGVSETVFEGQLRLLAREGLVPVTVSEGLRRLESGAPGHTVAMSFDDGYADNVWRALPRLQAVGGHATFYLAAGLIEDRRAPWWDELTDALERTTEPRLALRIGDRELELPLQGRGDRARALRALVPLMRVRPADRDARIAAVRLRLGVPERAACDLASWDAASALTRAGNEVGAHTMSHPHLTTLDADEQAREIAASAELIQRRMGVRPSGFAYPGGDYDARTVSAVRAVGLDHAVTTRAGDNAGGAQRYELRRRGWSEGSCLDPVGRFSARLARAELDGVFDRLRRVEVAS